MAVVIVSWPGLARPSTTLPPPALPVADGRHKAGHDTGRPVPLFYRLCGKRRTLQPDRQSIRSPAAFRLWQGNRICSPQHLQPTALAVRVFRYEWGPALALDDRGGASQPCMPRRLTQQDGEEAPCLNYRTLS